MENETETNEETETEEETETPTGSPLDRIAACRSREVQTATIKEWGDMVLELRESSYKEIRKIVLFYETPNKQGLKPENKLDYALCAKILYVDDKKLFKHTKHAEEVLSKQPSRIAQKVCLAVRLFCDISENAGELAEKD